MATKEAKSEKQWNPPKAMSLAEAALHAHQISSDTDRNIDRDRSAEVRRSQAAGSENSELLSEILAELRTIRALMQAHSAI